MRLYYRAALLSALSFVIGIGVMPPSASADQKTQVPDSSAVSVADRTLKPPATWVSPAVWEVIQRYQYFEDRPELTQSDYDAGFRIVTTNAELQTIWKDPSAYNILIYPEEPLYITAKPVAGRVYLHDPYSQIMVSLTKVRVYANMQLTLTGYAQARLYNSAQAVVTCNAQVFAYDSAQVTATDKAAVYAYDSAQVTAYNHTGVIASGSAHIIAYDQTELEANDSIRAQIISPTVKVTCEFYRPHVYLWVTPRTVGTTRECSATQPVIEKVASLPAAWNQLTAHLTPPQPVLSLASQVAIQEYRKLANSRKSMTTLSALEGRHRVRLVRTQQELNQALAAEELEAIFLLPSKPLRASLDDPAKRPIPLFVHDIAPPGKSPLVRVRHHFQVTATGTANVELSDTAYATASENSRITAYNTTRVTASGNATVQVRGKARVTARGNARVECLAGNQVTAYDNVMVKNLDDNVRVTGVGNSVRVWTIPDNHGIVAEPHVIRQLPSEDLRQLTWDELTTLSRSNQNPCLLF